MLGNGPNLPVLVSIMKESVEGYKRIDKCHCEESLRRFLYFNISVRWSKVNYDPIRS